MPAITVSQKSQLHPLCIFTFLSLTATAGKVARKEPSGVAPPQRGARNVGHATIPAPLVEEKFVAVANRRDAPAGCVRRGRRAYRSRENAHSEMPAIMPSGSQAAIAGSRVPNDASNVASFASRK